MSVPCDCLGCRIRAAIPAEFDPNEMLSVVTKIAAELLARASDDSAATFCTHLLIARQRFIAEQALLNTITPQGNA